jgi:hypothetical protein
LPGRQVTIVTYGVRRLDTGSLRLSEEHHRVGWFSVTALPDLPMPEGYRRSVRQWIAVSRLAGRSGSG